MAWQGLPAIFSKATASGLAAKIVNNLNYLGGRTAGDAAIELDKPLGLATFPTAKLPTSGIRAGTLAVDATENLLKIYDGSDWVVMPPAEDYDVTADNGLTLVQVSVLNNTETINFSISNAALENEKFREGGAVTPKKLAYSGTPSALQLVGFASRTAFQWITKSTEKTFSILGGTGITVAKSDNEFTVSLDDGAIDSTVMPNDLIVEWKLANRSVPASKVGLGAITPAKLNAGFGGGDYVGSASAKSFQAIQSVVRGTESAGSILARTFFQKSAFYEPDGVIGYTVSPYGYIMIRYKLNGDWKYYGCNAGSASPDNIEEIPAVPGQGARVDQRFLGTGFDFQDPSSVVVPAKPAIPERAFKTIVKNGKGVLINDMPTGGAGDMQKDITDVSVYLFNIPAFVERAPLEFASDPADRAWNVGYSVNWRLPAVSAFSGPADVITYSLTGIPDGLTFNPSSRRLTGAISSPFADTSMTYTASSQSGEREDAVATIGVSASYQFEMRDVPDIRLKNPASYSTVLPAVQSNGNETNLVYSVEGLPSGWSFDSATRTLSASSPTGINKHTITYKATASYGSTNVSASTTFVLSVITYTWSAALGAIPTGATVTDFSALSATEWYFVDAANDRFYKTTDAGATWTHTAFSGLPSDADIRGFSVVSSSEWYVSDYENYKVMKSTNSGSSWAGQAIYYGGAYNRSPRALSVISSSQRYVMAYGADDVLFSNGVGSTWTDVGTVNGIGGTKSMSMIDSDEWYTLERTHSFATYNKIYKTVDGGDNWELMAYIPSSKAAGGISAISSTELYAHILDSGHGHVYRLSTLGE